jgi:hypothetical protein
LKVKPNIIKPDIGYQAVSTALAIHTGLVTPAAMGMHPMVASEAHIVAAAAKTRAFAAWQGLGELQPGRDVFRMPPAMRRVVDYADGGRFVEVEEPVGIRLSPDDGALRAGESRANDDLILNSEIEPRLEKTFTDLVELTTVLEKTLQAGGPWSAQRQIASMKAFNQILSSFITMVMRLDYHVAHITNKPLWGQRMLSVLDNKVLRLYGAIFGVRLNINELPLEGDDRDSYSGLLKQNRDLMKSLFKQFPMRSVETGLAVVESRVVNPVITILDGKTNLTTMHAQFGRFRGISRRFTDDLVRVAGIPLAQIADATAVDIPHDDLILFVNRAASLVRQLGAVTTGYTKFIQKLKNPGIGLDYIEALEESERIVRAVLRMVEVAAFPDDVSQYRVLIPVIHLETAMDQVMMTSKLANVTLRVTRWQGKVKQNLYKGIFTVAHDGRDGNAEILCEAVLHLEEVAENTEDDFSENLKPRPLSQVGLDHSLPVLAGAEEMLNTWLRMYAILRENDLDLLLQAYEQAGAYVITRDVFAVLKKVLDYFSTQEMPSDPDYAMVVLSLSRIRQQLRQLVGMNLSASLRDPLLEFSSQLDAILSGINTRSFAAMVGFGLGVSRDGGMDN